MPHPKKDCYQTKKGDAANVVDGDAGIGFFENGCAETELEPFPYLKIDLGREQAVGRITVFPRGDKFRELKNYEIRVGNTGLRWEDNVICSPEGIVLSPGIENTIPCTRGCFEKVGGWDRNWGRVGIKRGSCWA